MSNDPINTPLEGMTFLQWLSDLFRRTADMIHTDHVDTDVVRQQMAREVSLRLLVARGEEERHRHTVNMLTERLQRLQNDESNTPARVLASPGTGATQDVRGRGRNDGGVPVPVVWPTLAMPADERVTSRVYDASREIERKAL